MSKKNLFLAASLISLIVFLSFLGKTGNHEVLGYSVNIWVIKGFCLVVALLNFINYLRVKNAEKN